MKKLKIAVFTSSRADYGLLRPLIDLFEKDNDIELLLLVAGGHLSKRFGYTKAEVEADKRKIAAEFDFLAEPPEDDYLTRSLAKLQEQIGAWLFKEKPDWIVVLGDRFELMAVAFAALVNRVPLAHISGGDITEGSLDNQVRHAVSKIAAAHFPANETAKKVLLSLGEEESRICVAGEPGLDQVLNMDYIPKDELFSQLGLDNELPVALITFHPDTVSNSINADFVESAINDLINKGFQVLATGSNFDEGGDKINHMLENLKAKNFKFIMSLGQKRYYSMLKHTALLLGNSSSGIVEAQSFNVPVVNVGSRQLGRLANPNVINAQDNLGTINFAVLKATDPKFKKEFFDKPNIYGDGKASQRIVEFLKNIPRENLLRKH